jgi:hypothetical protein
MITIGPTRWFVRASKTSERGGWNRYELSLIPEAQRYRILKVEYDGLAERSVEAVVDACELKISSKVDSWSDRGNDAARLVRSLCEEMSAEAIGEALRLQLMRPDGVEKRARQLIVRDALLKAIQGANEAVESVAEIDVRDYYMEVIERRIEAARQADERAAEEKRLDGLAKTHATASRKRSMELLYDNLPPEMVEEAKKFNRVTVRSGGDTFVVPVLSHGIVERYKAGKYVGSYCIIFGDHCMPLGDEVLMKIVLIKSDLPFFLKKANKFNHPGRVRPARLVP